MAGYIEKGKITSIDGNTARVVPCNESGLVSAQVVIPWHMRGGAGNIGKGTEVIYAVFDDQTGVLLMRADGNWGSSLPSLSVTGSVSAGSVSASSCAPRTESRPINSPAVSSTPMGVAEQRSISPVSIPASVFMMVTPDCPSPWMMHQLMGAEPRCLGSSEA